MDFDELLEILIDKIRSTSGEARTELCVKAVTEILANVCTTPQEMIGIVMLIGGTLLISKK